MDAVKAAMGLIEKRLEDRYLDFIATNRTDQGPGMSVRELANAVGYSESTVRKALQKLGPWRVSASTMGGKATSYEISKRYIALQLIAARKRIP